MRSRKYQYVGPNEIGEAARRQPSGTLIRSFVDLQTWLKTAETDQMPDGTAVATFVITVNHELMLAPRRSEHVACASGGPVLSAGEITFDEDLTVTEITNQSTGFCPEPESWVAVETVLDRIGLKHTGRFTTELVYRLCPVCHERNAVKDSWYYCALCDAKLTEHWNFDRDKALGEQ